MIFNELRNVVLFIVLFPSMLLAQTSDTVDTIDTIVGSDGAGATSSWWWFWVVVLLAIVAISIWWATRTNQTTPGTKSPGNSGGTPRS